jgi:hypothetical protein
LNCGNKAVSEFQPNEKNVRDTGLNQPWCLTLVKAYFSGGMPGAAKTSPSAADAEVITEKSTNQAENFFSSISVTCEAWALLSQFFAFALKF